MRSFSLGFTLIEMSIVLVIIGVLAGAILVGQNLIFAAQIIGTVSAMDRYKQAYNTFVNKYNCVPGDCPKATSFGLFSAGVCQNGGVPSTNSNGDGGGYIYSYIDGTENPAGTGGLYWGYGQ
jgi:prepilin-type N-terminal cleavage/methylation domain-containing protein